MANANRGPAQVSGADLRDCFLHFPDVAPGFDLLRTDAPDGPPDRGGAGREHRDAGPEDKWSGGGEGDNGRGSVREGGGGGDGGGGAAVQRSRGGSASPPPSTPLHR